MIDLLWFGIFGTIAGTLIVWAWAWTLDRPRELVLWPVLFSWIGLAIAACAIVLHERRWREEDEAPLTQAYHEGLIEE